MNLSAIFIVEIITDLLTAFIDAVTFTTIVYIAEPLYFFTIPLQMLVISDEYCSNGMISNNANIQKLLMGVK